MASDPIVRRATAAARVQNLPKQAPHSIEAEQSVIGGLLVRNEIWHDIADKITARDFYRTDHQQLFEAIADMLGAGKRCDFVTLTEHLREIGKLEEAGGGQYLGNLAGEAYSVQNVVAYAEIVVQRAQQRGLIAAGAEIGDLGYRTEGRDHAELMEEAERLLQGVRGRHTTDAMHVGPLLDGVAQRIERLKVRKTGELVGLATGFTGLDLKTQGMHPGDLIIVAARPAMGKTSFAMNVVEHVVLTKEQPAAVFTMEMTGQQLMTRVIASFGRIDLQHLRSAEMTESDYDRFSAMDGFLRKAPLYIDETGGLSPLELRSRARRMVARYGVKLIVVDYIQLMSVPGSRESRSNIVAEISRELKAMAKELRIPVIAVSQLSREVDKREDKRPKLSDLRESGGIEQDADVVLFLHREGYYDEDERLGKAEIIVAKQRSGPTGRVRAQWLGAYCKFDNPVQDDRYDP